jgi:stringent starvation protein B
VNDVKAMTSNRPYLIRAMYEWINDNGMTPHLVVDSAHPDLRVPQQAVRDGKVVLNIAQRAVAGFDVGDAYVSFHARFSGVSKEVFVPLAAVQAIYALESGQGMMLPEDNASAQGVGAQESAPPPDDAPPPRKGPSLRVVK